MKSDILFYAFRYALGRMSYCVSTVVDEIVSDWEEIDRYTQIRLHEEIRIAIRHNRAGMKMDIESWEQILKLEVSDE